MLKIFKKFAPLMFVNADKQVLGCLLNLKKNIKLKNNQVSQSQKN